MLSTFTLDLPSPANSSSSGSSAGRNAPLTKILVLGERSKPAPRRPRKRTFAHKVRSGCDTCKVRHIKCDETRPICMRCRKARFTCNYNIPKTWIFEQVEPNRPDTSNDDSAVVRQENDLIRAEDIQPALQPYWCTPEERRSLTYWATKTGPWLAHYAGKQAGQTWEIILPRCAQQLPAARHLMVAVSMLDERLSNPSQQLLHYRGHRILKHYNTAIKTLTSGEASQLDILLSSMVAWVLETMSEDPQTAKMHLDASGRILRKIIAESPHDDSSEEQDIIHQHITRAHQQCIGYAKMEHIPEENQEPEADSVFPALVARNNPQTISSIMHIKRVIKEYYNQLNLAKHKGIDVAQARYYRRSYEVALLKYRHAAKEPAVNIIAVHYWLNLVNNLLPKTDEAEIAAYESMSAMDYVLDRVEEFYATEGLAPEHREDLEETLNLTLINVIRFASEEKHLVRARAMMRRMDQGG